jgi:hypothetical protein
LNSKQVLAAVAAVVLIAILVYPSVSTGAVSVSIQATSIDKADHVFVTIDGIWAHPVGQASASWTSISNQSETVDLISIQNSTKLLRKGQIASGQYDSVRIEVTNVTWVFNKTTKSLGITSPELQTSIVFTVGSGNGASIALTITGQKQLIANSDYFAGTLTATLAT